MLQGVIGREAGPFHLGHGFAPFAHHFFGARDNAPADPPTWCHVRFGQPIERDHGDLSINGSDGRWGFSTQDQLVVDFISKQHGASGFASGDDLLKHSSRGDRARWIVGIDKHQGLGWCSQKTGDFFHVGLPVVGFVQVVRDGHRVEFGQDGGVERISWCWHQDPISSIHQRGKRDFDRLGTATGDGNVLDGFHASRLRILPNG